MVVGYRRDGASDDGSAAHLPLQHWWLANIDGSQQVDVHPQVVQGDVLLEPDIEHLAWHPQPSSLLYAVYDGEGSVHLVDAKRACRIRSWTQAELCTRDEDKISLGEGLPALEALRWSPDGCQLAVLLDKAAVVLSFA